MDIGSVLGQVPLVLSRNSQIIVGLGTSGDVDMTEAARLFDGLLRPDASLDVVGRSVFRQQVQRDLSKLLAGTTLQEQDFVVGGTDSRSRRSCSAFSAMAT